MRRCCRIAKEHTTWEGEKFFKSPAINHMGGILLWQRKRSQVAPVYLVQQIIMTAKVIKLDQHTQVGSETKRQNLRNSIYGSGAALLAVGEIPTPPTKITATQYKRVYI